MSQGSRTNAMMIRLAHKARDLISPHDTEKISVSTQNDLESWEAGFYKRIADDLAPAVAKAIREVGSQLIRTTSGMPSFTGSADSPLEVVYIMRASQLGMFGKVKGDYTPTQIHRVSRICHIALQVENRQGEIVITVKFDMRPTSKLEKLFLADDTDESAPAAFGIQCQCTVSRNPRTGRLLPVPEVIFDKPFLYPEYVHEGRINLRSEVKDLGIVYGNGSYRTLCTIRTEYWETTELELSLYGPGERDEVADVMYRRGIRTGDYVREMNVMIIGDLLGLYFETSKVPLSDGITRALNVAGCFLDQAIAETPYYLARGDRIATTMTMIKKLRVLELGQVLSKPKLKYPHQKSQLLRVRADFTDEEDNIVIKMDFCIKPISELVNIRDPWQAPQPAEYGVEFKIRYARETSITSFAYGEFVPLLRHNGVKRTDKCTTEKTFPQRGIRGKRSATEEYVRGRRARVDAST